MRATMRNSRAGYAKHNDRDFNIYSIDNDGHIDVNRQHLNTYWHCYEGQEISFADAERKYYEEHYSEALKESNQKQIARRHREQCKTMADILSSRRGAPEETILQIGDRHNTVDLKTFEACVQDYIKELEKFSSHIHIIDWAIHGDEETPHAHIRKVYDYVDENGHENISQVKALEALGFERPDPEAAISRINNSKIAFDSYMRDKWYDICLEHDIEIERDPRDNIAGHRDKEQFIADQKLEEEKAIEDKINDMQESIDSLTLEVKRLEKENKDKDKLLEKQEKELMRTREALRQTMKAYKHEAGSREARRLAREQEVDKSIFAPKKKDRIYE